MKQRTCGEEKGKSLKIPCDFMPVFSDEGSALAIFHPVVCAFFPLLIFRVVAMLLNNYN